jgi:hypothetical protein
MDTLEMGQLYRRYQRYERVAMQYNAVLDERAGGHVHVVIDPAQQTLTPTLRLGMHVVAIPKSIPRDRPTAWYVEQYCRYRAKASDAGDLYWSLKDAAKKRAWDALDREGKRGQLRAIGARIVRIEQTIQEYQAKCPAWDLKLAEQGPITTAEDQVWAWMHSVSNPHSMVETMTEALAEAQAERDWLLEHS